VSVRTTIAILTTIWRRPALTACMLRHYGDMQLPGVDFLREAVRSGDDPEPAPPVRGWTYVHASNEPLAGKWQAGLDALRAAAPDVVVVVGSDDFACQAYFNRARLELAGRAEYLQLGSCYFHDLATGRTIYARRLEIGAFRAFSRRLLDRARWILWPNRAGNPDGLQDHLLRRFRRTVVADIRREGIVAVDVKAELCRWSFDHLASHTFNEPVAGLPPALPETMFARKHPAYHSELTTTSR